MGSIKKTHFDEDGTLQYGTVAFTGGPKVYLSGKIWGRTRDHINALGIQFDGLELLRGYYVPNTG